MEIEKLRSLGLYDVANNALKDSLKYGIGETSYISAESGQPGQYVREVLRWIILLSVNLQDQKKCPRPIDGD